MGGLERFRQLSRRRENAGRGNRAVSRELGHLRLIETWKVAARSTGVLRGEMRFRR